MITVYLKENYTGAYSAIQYGVKGDKVYVLRRDETGMTLVMNDNGLKFFVRDTILSHQPIQKDATILPVHKPTKRKVR